MREAFEQWWDEQRMLGTEYSPYEGTECYLNTGNEPNVKKKICWLAWQGAFASLKEKVSV